MLTSLRLHLKEVTIHDLNQIHELLSLPETDEYNTMGIPESIEATRTHLEQWFSDQKQDPRMSYTLAVSLIDSNQFIGLVGIKLGIPKYKNAHVWYKLHKDFWNFGYATEATKELLRFGFEELQLHRIEAGCDIENIGSIKVLEKVGMVREGIKRKNLPIRGDWKDNFFYAILEEDWLHSLS